MVAKKKFRFNKEQRAWLKDLSTTKAPQVRGVLGGKSQGGWCCLGRACVVSRAKYSSGDCYLPDGLDERLGIKSQDALIELNDDDKLTFKQIAAEVRKNPAKYLKEAP